MEKGLVLKSTGTYYTVRTDKGAEITCRIRGNFRIKGIKSTSPVAVGDWVGYVNDPKGEHYIITKIFERKNYLIRKSVNLSKQIHILAANIDQVVIVVTLVSPKTLLGFIDRILVSAEAYNIPTCLVFNKIDIYEEAEMNELEFLELVYQQANCKTLRTSVVDQYNINAFKDLLKDKTTLLAGNSGVGKSSLVNAIAPGLELKTKEVSETHQQGQHTTTFAEMHALPFGGDIIDTPGVRGFGLVNIEKEEIAHFFPEIFKISENCRFNNCLHNEEPGCAVREAVESHTLAHTRYKSYLNMLHGLDEEGPYRKDVYAE